MSKQPMIKTRTLAELFHFFIEILGPENRYYILALVYGVGISLLSLATPISVQMLINTVANTGLTTPLVVLSLTLFGLLTLAGLLQALRIHLMDLFGRRFYARMVSEIALRAIYATNPFFDDDSRAPLFNRYFDIIIVQKRLPVLFVGGFTILLQTFVGFVLTSFYHPYLLVFNLVIVGLVWLVWAIWGKRAIKSSMEVSHKKHATAAWLESLGSSNGFFKSAQHVTDALYRTDEVTANYIREHERHFRQHFSQTLMFLFIWAAASASLLGLGGWLVIQGQLSLGQLVAAELVLSVVFAGIAQLGTYLTYFYDLCAAVEELSLFHDVEQDPPTLTPRPTGQGASISFANAVGESRGTRLTLDFTIPAGSRVFAASHNHAAQRVFTSFMKRHERPDSGYIALGGQDFDSFQAHHLRQDIIVLDRPRIVEASIREYLEFSMKAEQEDDLLAVLETVGLDSVISQLGEGLDTRLAATGWPLSTLETMQLKLASALVAHPRVLVLSQIYDMMPDEYMLASFERLQQSDRTTIVYFSNKHTDLNFDQFLYLGEDQQQLYESYHQLCDAAELPRRALEPVSGRPQIVQAS